ncbi:hypothetical protein D6B98_39255 [Bradyrhizobium sp. LVM 105]|nr:hypothetical protein D6B98_39255 [Bradyrhizobium sp. LVM 105]
MLPVNQEPLHQLLAVNGRQSGARARDGFHMQLRHQSSGERAERFLRFMRGRRKCALGDLIG